MAHSPSTTGISFTLYFPQGVPLTPTSHETTVEKGVVHERMEIGGTSAYKQGFWVISLDIKDPNEYVHERKALVVTYVDESGKTVSKTHGMGVGVNQSVISLANHATLKTISAKVQINNKLVYPHYIPHLSYQETQLTTPPTNSNANSSSVDVISADAPTIATLEVTLVRQDNDEPPKVQGGLVGKLKSVFA